MDQSGIAEALWNLYVPPDTEPVYGKFGRAENDKVKYGFRAKLKLKHFIEHVDGSRYIEMAPLQQRRATWIAADIDTKECDTMCVYDKTHIAVAKLLKADMPVVVNFSGQKGFHLTTFFDTPCSADESMRLGGQWSRLLASVADKIGASRTPLALPLGIHRLTGHRCQLCYPDTLELMPERDTLDFLLSVPKLTLSRERNIARVATVERIHPWRECLNVLWKEGIQRPGTRHHVLVAVIAAVKNCTDIPREKQLDYLADWVERTHPPQETGLTTTNLEGALKEMNRMHGEVEGCYKPSCKNSLYRHGMESACTPERRARCAIAAAQRSGSRAEWCRTLRASGIWAQLGQSTGILYDALVEAATEEGRGLTVQLSLDGMAERAGISKSSASNAVKKLKELGLVTTVECQRPKRNRGQAIPAYHVPEVGLDALPSLLARVF